MGQRGVNKVILIGNVGQDPECRYTQGGDAVTTISLATSEQWVDKQSGQKQERTEWSRVVFWRKLAEVVSQYVVKGSKLYVEGKLQTRKWTDQNGIERYSTEIKAHEMQLLDGKPSGHASQPPKDGAYAGTWQHAAPAQNSQPQANPSPYAGNPQGGQGGFDDWDSGIPFD